MITRAAPPRRFPSRRLQRPAPRRRRCRFPWHGRRRRRSETRTLRPLQSGERNVPHQKVPSSAHNRTSSSPPTYSGTDEPAAIRSRKSSALRPPPANHARRGKLRSTSLRLRPRHPLHRKSLRSPLPLRRNRNRPRRLRIFEPASASAHHLAAHGLQGGPGAGSVCRPDRRAVDAGLGRADPFPGQRAGRVAVEPRTPGTGSHGAASNHGLQCRPVHAIGAGSGHRRLFGAEDSSRRTAHTGASSHDAAGRAAAAALQSGALGTRSDKEEQTQAGAHRIRSHAGDRARRAKSFAGQSSPRSSQPSAPEVPVPANPGNVTTNGVSDEELQQQNLPPLRGPWVRVQREKRVISPREEAETQLQTLESGYSPWMGGTGVDQLPQRRPWLRSSLRPRVAFRDLHAAGLQRPPDRGRQAGLPRFRPGRWKRHHHRAGGDNIGHLPRDDLDHRSEPTPIPDPPGPHPPAEPPAPRPPPPRLPSRTPPEWEGKCNWHFRIWHWRPATRPTDCWWETSPGAPIGVPATAHSRSASCATR